MRSDSSAGAIDAPSGVIIADMVGFEASAPRALAAGFAGNLLIRTS